MMKYLCGLRITTRFILLSLPAILVMAASLLTGLELFKKHSYELIEREMEALTLVAANAVGAHSSREEMIEIVKRLPATNEQYFFVINKDLVFEHHINKNIEGTKVSNSNLIEMVKQAFNTSSKHASGIYLWKNSRKLSSVRYIDGQGVVIGTGLNLIGEERRLEQQQYMVLIVILGLVIVNVISMMVLRRSLNPALRNIDILANSLSRKDLTDNINVFGKDEFSQAFVTLKEAISHLRDSMVAVDNRAAATNDLGDDLAVKMTTVKTSSQRQSDELTQVATGMQEMSATIQEVSSTIDGAVTDIEGIKIGVDEATEQTSVTVKAVDGLISVNNKWADRTGELVLCSEKMSGIVDGIVDIADQTNLLALNAAIEAARAGDVGRGFAVVADEVRNLSTKTTEQVEYIRDLIDQLAKLANSCGEFADSSQSELTKVKANSLSSNQRLEQVLESVTAVTESMTQVAVAAEEQSTTTEQVNQNINAVESLSKGLLSDVDESTKYTQLTKDKAAELQKLVSSYRL